MPKKIETIAIHGGMDYTNAENASIVPPMEPSTIFEHKKKGYTEGDRNYIRYSNPNRDQLEELLANLEQGKACAAFSSGVAAITAIFQALHPGSHILLPVDLYHGSRVLIQEFAAGWNLDYDFVDTTNLQKVEEAMKAETRLVWTETPSNPLQLISSVEALANIAHKHEALVAVDNTWPTPYNMQPLTLGADLVMHSTTKYLGGHSDILGGAVIANNEKGIFSRIRNIQQKQGAVPSPRDCWLLSRSIRSFPYRMRGHNENAQQAAAFLVDHPKVQEVYYPGLETHPGHAIAKAEMNGFGGMISFLVDGGAEEALQVVAGSRIIRRATSLGGVESTWEHRCSSEGENSETPENLIRLSVGLEHPEDIIEDLTQALSLL
ncbi:MAG: aminotransferase class I/II-fold pyridoxal phosphate-dependent enzyme [Balneolaceae bacterium]|nr:aminotransferase class I/II-fold pyridoxal phosphate-dependent enzyme [Balneolaceae bacterium]